MHLWEIEHAYYCNDGNFTSNGCLEQVDSFDAFMDLDGSNFGSDFDLNLVFRWDWVRETEDDSDELSPAGELGKGTLKLYRMQQRKGHFFITHIAVGPEDEEAVRVFLAAAWKHMRELWAPIAPMEVLIRLSTD